MNEAFKSERSSIKKYIVRQLLIAILVVAALPVYNLALSKGPVANSYYYWMGAIFLISFIKESFRNRISEIEFNTDIQKIVFHFGNLFTLTKQKTLRFEIARLEVDTLTGWFGESLEIYFTNNKLEVFKVDKHKDGFSKETLKEIKIAANNLGLPVSKY